MKAITRFGAALAVAAAVLTFGTVGAQATPDPTIQTMLDEVTTANPGARQIDADTVRLANGVEVTASAPTPCLYKHLCIFDGVNLTGRQWSFYNCGFVNIGGAGWSDRIQSFDNNQTLGTVSIFMNWSGSNWQELYRSRAREVQMSVNIVHWTDGIWVC
ncbi:peptidase inhibitor family I36 protein [Lentzea tibetensis]|uniref:peptidase inhibitor family I36 protein n=1 Tax=Lentzea tibetensis TaxID=2591470 RepID=UPI0016444C71|nr:peptidase inhibitor family I36 protein [Lentzea tibetensis]